MDIRFCRPDMRPPPAVAQSDFSSQRNGGKYLRRFAPIARNLTTLALCLRQELHAVFYRREGRWWDVVDLDYDLLEGKYVPDPFGPKALAGPRAKKVVVR